MKNLIKKKLSYTQIIASVYAIIILIGTLLLCLPLASREGSATSFIDSLFTATSATCVTGLSVFDTYTHWSLFGQIVILGLIQIGGLGFMTCFTLLMMALKRSIRLHERVLTVQSAGVFDMENISKMIQKIALGTIIFEGTGTLLLAIRFCPILGFGKGIYYALFHSVSAFCNAGFDILGGLKAGGSLTYFATDYLVNITIILLIVIGGLGFVVWNDLLLHGWHVRKYHLHTKIVLMMTALLFVVGTGLFFVFEIEHTHAGLSVGDSVLMSAFQSITPRTAGFFTADYANMSESGILLTTILMLIGGSPGSTAGGIKTTTVLVLFLGTFASVRNTQNVTVFKRRLDDASLRQAMAVFAIYISFVMVITMLICAIQDFSLKDVLFEVVSAVATVGLSTGITPELNTMSQFLLVIGMFGGRIGMITLAAVLTRKHENVPVERPVEKILIG